MRLRRLTASWVCSVSLVTALDENIGQSQLCATESSLERSGYGRVESRAFVTGAIPLTQRF